MKHAVNANGAIPCKMQTYLEQLSVRKCHHFPRLPTFFGIVHSKTFVSLETSIFYSRQGGFDSKVEEKRDRVPDCKSVKQAFR